jgi:hypothetical protein
MRNSRFWRRTLALLAGIRWARWWGLWRLLPWIRQSFGWSRNQRAHGHGEDCQSKTGATESCRTGSLLRGHHPFTYKLRCRFVLWGLRNGRIFEAGKLVLTARVQNREDHQIGIREKPLLGFGARGWGYPGKFAEMLVEGESAQVVEADSGEPDHLVLGKELLAGLYPNHSRSLPNRSMLKRD